MRYLLGLNLLVLAAGLGTQYLMSKRPPDLSEFNAGKIRFWSQPAATKAATASPAAPAPAVPAEAQAIGEPGHLCFAFDDLSQARYREIRAALKQSGLDVGQCQFGFEKRLGWWVFWPPEYEAARREKVLRSIKAAGVRDFLPVNQGPMAQAFSLGVFSSEGAANQYRDALRAKGLGKVEFGPRPSMGAAWLGCQSDDPVRLDSLSASLPAWANPKDQAACDIKPPPR